MNGSCSASFVAFVGLLLALLAGSAAGASYRLDGSIAPSHYNLTIGVLRDAAEPALFDGEVGITLRLARSEPVSVITLHSDGLNISECWLLDAATGAQVEVIASDRLTYDAATQQVNVPLTQALQPERNYTLGFKYVGRIRTDLVGLFSASYVEQGTNATKWMAVTQMQRINARLVLPCFDEPALKAKFQLQIERPDGYQAIANTRLVETTAVDQGRFVDHFIETPVMSTYLLAFIIANYSARGDVSEYAVLSRPEFYNYTEFSYQVGQVVPAYEELFQSYYKQLGNDVLQFASSPRFPHNGMENWGLIIYSEDVLVQEPGFTDDWSNKEFAARIISHETSHMWFGDSVTFSWWSYFWLNEAFARYYEYFMANQFYPEYHLDEQFVVRQMQLIFDTDAKNSTQPLTSPESEIQTPAQIAYKFSGITYAKGACIVRMWRNAMGADNFDTAIRSYLKDYHLQNTVPENLFYYLYENWPKTPYVDLVKFFADYTEQVGYPMLMVNMTSEHFIYVEQKRFLLNPKDGSDETLRYTVPITYATNVAPNFYNLTPVVYMDKLVDLVKLYFEEPIDWIVLNLRQSNYQRVLYDPTLMSALQVALSASNHSGIPVENRAQIIDDLFNFAFVGYLDYAEVFEFLEYLSREVGYVPWYAVYENLNLVAKRLTPEQLPNFRIYLSDITGAAFDKLGLGWSAEDTPLDVAHRNKLVTWLCRYKIKQCREKINVKFVTEMEEKPLPDYRETFYCAAASDDSSLMLIWSMYFLETRPKEKQMLWMATSCTQHYDTYYRRMILEWKSVSVENKKAGIARLYEQNPDLVQPIFEMITANITELALDLGSWSDTAEVVSDMVEYFTTRDQQQLLKVFYQDNQQLFGESASVLSRAMDSVEQNLQWAEQRLDKLVIYLSRRNGSSGQEATSIVVLLLALASLLAWL